MLKIDAINVKGHKPKTQFVKTFIWENFKTSEMLIGALAKPEMPS